MKAADTNVILRLLLEDDQAQLKTAERELASGLWISHLVLVEVIWVLGGPLYRLPKHHLVGVVEHLLKVRELSIQEPELVVGALDHFREGNAGFADCLILEVARRAGNVPLLTFDDDLSKLDGAVKPILVDF